MFRYSTSASGVLPTVKGAASASCTYTKKATGTTTSGNKVSVSDTVTKRASAGFTAGFKLNF